MELQQKENEDNGVKENYPRENRRVVPPGRDYHEQQVEPDRHQASVENTQNTGRDKDTNREDNKKVKGKLKIATWNVRTFHQTGKLASIEK